MHRLSVDPLQAYWELFVDRGKGVTDQHMGLFTLIDSTVESRAHLTCERSFYWRASGMAFRRKHDECHSVAHLCQWGRSE
jgi:hypothetical protein